MRVGRLASYFTVLLSVTVILLGWATARVNLSTSVFRVLNRSRLAQHGISKGSVSPPRGQSVSRSII